MSRRDPSLYECAECSAKPGSPSLCRRCLEARAAAGDKWRGPLPMKMPAVGKSLAQAAKERADFIMARRERFLEAWIAETGILPSETELVETTSADTLTTTVTVRRRSTPARP
ncbi:MAG: hypothetical protein AMXMBFR56_82580 [Polyangiaceae bacterium]